MFPIYLIRKYIKFYTLQSSYAISISYLCFIKAIAWAMFTLILLASLFHSILLVFVIVVVVTVLMAVIEFLKN